MSSIPETEVLFLVLTHIQRDLITEAPGQMSLIVNCLREAFLTTDVPPQVIIILMFHYAWCWLVIPPNSQIQLVKWLDSSQLMMLIMLWIKDFKSLIGEQFLTWTTCSRKIRLWAYFLLIRWGRLCCSCWSSSQQDGNCLLKLWCTIIPVPSSSQSQGSSYSVSLVRQSHLWSDFSLVVKCDITTFC